MKKRNSSINRLLYTLLVLCVFIIMGVGVFIVNAYGGTQPSVMGHSVGEIEGVCRTDGTGCPNFDTIPAGAVMSFDLTSCPSGWSEYTSARDRTIIGSGSSYSRGATGGASTHTLTIAEMPSHRHTNYDRGRYSHGDVQVAGSLVGVVSASYSSYEGGNQPHNNMQPYIALLYCVKN